MINIQVVVDCMVARIECSIVQQVWESMHDDMRPVSQSVSRSDQSVSQFQSVQ